MKIGFWGTPSHAAEVLKVLLNSEFEVKAVYTGQDKPIGRGRSIRFNPVKVTALESNIPVWQPGRLDEKEVAEQLRDSGIDVCVVAGYGQILPASLLNVPKYGFLNIHPSLLPKYRGASPVASAILHQQETTGVSIMVVDKNIDAGPLLAQIETNISSVETAESLSNRLFVLGAHLLVQILPNWFSGKLDFTHQNASMATYTRKFVKEDGKIQWKNTAHEICARLRAFSPWPGVYTHWSGNILKIIEAYPIENVSPGRPGTVIMLDKNPKSIGVCTGNGIVIITRLRLAGRRDTDTWSFTRGYPEFVGSVLASDNQSEAEP